VKIRHYQPGDENAQLAIYNTAGDGLNRFKPATLFEITKRIQAKDFDAASRWYAEEGGQVVAYSGFQPHGRVSYPWCLPGHEHLAEPLFAQVVKTMKSRNFSKIFAAYRQDWPAINTFFEKQGFVHVRDMVNFVLAFENMPTPSARIGSNVTPAQPDDVAKIYALAPSVFRSPTVEAFKEHLWKNPYFTPAKSLFVLRNRNDNAPLAAAMLITDSSYADPRPLDSFMPCFRLGAFGTEGMSTKRVKGLFSIVANLDKNLYGLGMELLGYAACQLGEKDDIWCFAAQVASDVPLLYSFYQRNFEQQGSFPVYEKSLNK
jgi:hypothetical protein